MAISSGAIVPRARTGSSRGHRCLTTDSHRTASVCTPEGLQGHSMLTFKKLAWINHARRAVFRVEAPSHGVVYMSAQGDRNRSVVEVDVQQRFLAAWRTPGARLAELAFGSPRTWGKDKKFRHAQR